MSIELQQNAHDFSAQRSRMADFLLKKRDEDGFFRSTLSDSAISTAVACLALEAVDANVYSDRIAAARKWLAENHNKNGAYGDTPQSPSNVTATFMAYVALSRKGITPKETRDYLASYLSDFSFDSVRKLFLAEYGDDLTFSVPIMAMATAAGFFADAQAAWRAMPRFPFEAVIIPERFFHLLNLPVVSYAIPALISVGLAQNHFRKPGLSKFLGDAVTGKALKVLKEKQPKSGGFLEAAPLTAFCVLCLTVANLKEHEVTKNAVDFLVKTQRENGSWPIDRDLRQWVTSLALTALAPDLSPAERELYRTRIKAQQTTTVHPFTQSQPGGWGWTTFSGSVPDGDDTAAALIALHALGEPVSESVQQGISWILDLQNSDGGIPTFCRGWGKLPFDKSCADISAHCFRALALFYEYLPLKLRKRVEEGCLRIINFLSEVQNQDGSFHPLWFGDQYAKNKEAPAYGTAVVLEHLTSVHTTPTFLSGPRSHLQTIIDGARSYLLNCQHASGAWGSTSSDRDYVIFTARAITALQGYSEAKESIDRALRWLEPSMDSPETLPREPIGLYFAHLWYDEELYGPIFLASCLKSIQEEGIQ